MPWAAGIEIASGDHDDAVGRALFERRVILMFRRTVWPVFLLLVFCSYSYAQYEASGRIEVQGGAGWAAFPDEGPNNHVLAGGVFQAFLFRGFNIGAETFYWVGPGNDRDVTIMPLAGYEFKRSARVRPFVVGGVGVLLHSEGRYWSHGGTFGGGAGFKISITDRLYVAPEFRLGWEPVLRTAVNFGYRL